MIKLKEHIAQKYDGNQARCAKANGKTPQWLTPMIKNGNHFVLDGDLYIKKGKIK